MLPVLLTISLRVVGFYEDLKGVPIEVCTFSDADVVPQNVVSEEVAQVKANRCGEVLLEAASTVVLMEGNLPKKYAAFLHVVI